MQPNPLNVSPASPIEVSSLQSEMADSGKQFLPWLIAVRQETELHAG